MTANRCKVLEEGDKNVLKLDSGDSFTILMNILKANELYTFKWVILLACKLCFNKADLKQKQTALKGPNTSEVT